MKWDNLKSMMCPKCSSLLNTSFLTPLYHCTNSDCTFKITEASFDKIVADRYHKQKNREMSEEDNLSTLNNMGHNIVAKDFSDSPFADKNRPR